MDKHIVYSGSFDPFHIGHEFIVDYILKNISQNLTIVVQPNPDKNGAKYSCDMRVEMIKEVYPSLDVVYLDYLYYYELLNHYDKSSFVLGGDAFLRMPSWEKYDTFQDREFIVFDRDGFKGGISGGLDISSSMIKLCDDNLRDNVNPKVWNYLRGKNLIKEYWRPSASADIVVVRGNSILLLERKTEPYKNKYVLVGGHLDYTDDTFTMCAVRELEEETGIIVKESDLVEIGVFYSKNRDPRKRMISVAYVVEVAEGVEVSLSAENDKYRWVDFGEVKEEMVGFDHYEIISRAMGI